MNPPKGPIKHCWRCKAPMMVQINFCKICGTNTSDDYTGPQPLRNAADQSVSVKGRRA